MVFRTHKSCLLKPIDRSQVSASGVQLVEKCLSGYHTEKYHTVSLLSKSIDHTMDTTSTRSCYNPSEKTMDFAEDYRRVSKIKHCQTSCHSSATATPSSTSHGQCP